MKEDKIKILIAEDDLISRRLLQAMLMKRGYDVVVTCDGDEAWNVLQKENHPQLAILDWMMPGLSGLDVCKKVRTRQDGSFIYVILLTAKGRREDITAGFEAGVDDYVTKPFDPKELQARVQVGVRMIKLQNTLAEHVEKLKELDQWKSDFISVVSHELRTPIAIMRGGVSLCLDGIAGTINDQQKELLIDTLESIDRLGRLVTDLLDVSKIEAGKVKLRRGSIDMCTIVKKILNGFEPQMKEKDIQFITELPEGELKIFADGDKVTQIFNNLISNAIRFAGKGEKIVIKVEDGDEFIQCRVTDTGVGISEQNLSKLFSKFEQFGRPEGSDYKGTGLGLTIAKGLVEKHGGTIWAESEMGKGTTFWFTLKKIPFPNILVVDDEQNIIEIIEKFLSADNYRFIEALNGKEAIERAMKENPSLIVLDMMLPEMDGYEVIRQLKQNKQTHDIPILAISAKSVDEERLGQVNGQKEIPFLEKPVEPDLLLDNVKEMLYL
ncbi:response regulator [bacterium]|nr:response regulator [bacterium]